MEHFFELKSSCDALMKCPNEYNVRNFANMTENIPDTVIEDLLEYSLLPLITHLNNNNNSLNIKEELVKSMRIVIRKARIRKLKCFFDIYGSLLIQIFDKSQSNNVIEFHEELKEAVALCIKDIIHQCFTDVIESLYTKENTIKLGQGILLCLTLARTEKSSVVKLAAINALMALCQIDDEADKSDIIFQDQVADTIMAFLPGIVSGLQEIAMESEIQNHKVTVMAIRAWGRIISLIVHDKEEEDITLSIEALMKKSSSTSTNALRTPVQKASKAYIKTNLKNGIRDQEWFEAVSIRLGTCIQLLDKVKSHPHYKVRKELVESIGLILRNCSKNLKSNIMILVDHLISLSEDESTEVSEKAHDVLNTINENYMSNHNMRSLVDLLEERFYSLLTRLPTIIRWSDDYEQLVSLNQFAGYLRLLGKKRLPRIMKSEAHMRRLLFALVHIMVIDCNSITLLQATAMKNLDDLVYYYRSNSWKEFKFIKSNPCQEKLVVICKLLGKFGDFRILIDAILELMSDAAEHRKELNLLLNWILASVEDSSILHLSKQIVDFYTMQEIWYLPIEVTEDTSLVEAQSNIVQCCLLIEGLGHIATKLKLDYDTYLLKTLYLILERAGSSNSLISYIGVCTLQNIATSQQHKMIGDLLRANVDYFSYHIMIKLRHIKNNPGVLDVIAVIMKYSRSDFLPYLKGIVEDILRQLSTSFNQKNACSFLNIFHIFIGCIKTLISWEDTKIKTKENVCTTSNPSEMIIYSLLEYYNAKKVDEKIDDTEEITSNIDESNIELPDESNEDYNDPNTDDKQDKKLPTHIKIIIEIMKRCLHFMPSKNVQESLIAMQTLQEGLPILVEWENELLPIIHQLWHPLTDRFKDKNVLIINRAWQLLYVLADISNTFIKSRTLREVLPSVFKFLTESSKESMNKNSASIYKFTQIYKLQYVLLSTLGLISRLLELREQELWQILSNTELYLNACQNPTLQACCVKLYKDIADYNGDIAWVKCLSIWNSKITHVASDATLDINSLLNSDNAPSNEYYANINEIIKYIQTKNI